MSDPTESDRAKARDILPCSCGGDERHFPHSGDCPARWRDVVAEALADARIDDRYYAGLAEGRRQMREDAAHIADVQAKCSDSRADAETIAYLIRALPDHPETSAPVKED